jgi:4-amino-4-deoxy-L-arabinose transferase-like glycosyltransferase
VHPTTSNTPAPPRVILLLAVAAAVLFADAAVSELHGTAVFYASMAREMADARDPLVAFTDERAYLLKPPLLLWLSAAAVAWLGPSGFAASLASRLFGLATLALTVHLGRRLYGASAGWFAGLVLVTNSTFLQFTNTVRMESLVTTGVLLALIGYLQGGRRGPLAFFSGVTIGLLAKGPAGLLPLALAPVHAWLTGRRPGPALAWFRASLVLVAPAVWFGYMFHLHGATPITDLAADALRGGHEGVAPQLQSAVSVYVESPLRRYWPWLPFMVAGVVYAARECRPGVAARRRRRSLLLLVWIAMVIVAAAVKPDHDIRYLYPALPAIAVLAGWVLARIFRARVPGFALAATAAGGLFAFACMLEPDWLFDDARPAIAQIRAAVEVHTSPGAPIPVVGTQITDARAPRRQNDHRDWVHFYLGRPVTLHYWESVDAQALAREPLVLIAEMPDWRALAGKLGLRAVVSTEEILLAVPAASADGRSSLDTDPGLH